MGCPGDLEMARFLEGGLGADELVRVRSHLEGCASCQDLVGVLAGEALDATIHDVNKLARGAKIGRFVIGQVLGAGGMGEVHEGLDPKLDRRVALKVLRPDRNDSAVRLLREAKALARLSHPNVVTVYEAGEDAGRVFLAMELVDGVSLSTWRATRRSWREVVDVFLGAGQGLAAAHAAGIAHRDFKPDNVMMGRDGRPRVVDFGLAKRDREAEIPGASHSGASTFESQVLTEDGFVMGTLAYMAPEQLGGTPGDARSDQFSFAVSLYETLYGSRPFAGRDTAALRKSMDAPLSKPSGVPRAIFDAIAKGLAVDPSRRHPSMDAFLDALRPARRTNAWWPVAIGAGILVGTIVLLLVSNANAPSTTSVRGEPVTGSATPREVESAITSAAPATSASAATTPMIAKKPASRTVHAAGSASSRGLFDDIR